MTTLPRSTALAKIALGCPCAVNEAGIRLVDFFRDELSSGHTISPVARRGPRSDRFVWSTRDTPHLAKLVQPLLLSEEITGIAAVPVAAGLIECVKQQQEAEGYMGTDPDARGVMLHPQLYAAEGLWIWGSATGDQDALERASAAVEWVWAQQLEQGGAAEIRTGQRRQCGSLRAIGRDRTGASRHSCARTTNRRGEPRTRPDDRRRPAPQRRVGNRVPTGLDERASQHLGHTVRGTSTRDSSPGGASDFLGSAGVRLAWLANSTRPVLASAPTPVGADRSGDYEFRLIRLLVPWMPRAGQCRLKCR